MKALVGAFNQEKALVGAFSVIVKSDCGTDGALHNYTALQTLVQLLAGALAELQPSPATAPGW